MLDVVLPALVDTCLTGMSLPCLLHPKMSMKLRYSLRWSVGFLLFWQWLEHKSFPSLIIHLMWSTVQGVGSTGMLMASTLEHCYILLYYSLFYSIQNCWLILFYTISCNVWDTCIFLMLLYLRTGGKPLLELNRVLRPGGYYIWSATPVYRKDQRDKDDWNGLWIVTVIYHLIFFQHKFSHKISLSNKLCTFAK